MQEIEQWKDIPGYEGIYKISNLCKLKSLSRTVYNSAIKGENKFYISREKELTGCLDNNGYRTVSLSKNGKYKTFGIHVLMAMAFMEYIPSTRRIIIDHKDNTRRFDNTVSNLQIITNRENTSKDRKNTSSKHTGLYWDKRGKKWRVSIFINNKAKYLGMFNNEDKAIESYNNALKSI